MSLPFFSVIIPAYNRANFIRRALQSVQEQTFRDFELIVVDDGSSDATAEVAADSCPSVKIYRQKNLGPGPARNRGIAEAQGHYIAFLDSDDLWFPWTLQSYREAIELHGEPPCLFGSVIHFSEREPLAPIVQEKLETKVYPDYLATAETDVFQGTGVAVLKLAQAREMNGFLSERMFCEDLDFFMRMGTTGPVVHVRRPTLVGLFGHSEGSMSDMSRTHEGTAFLLAQEKRGAYPGGRTRRSERLRLLLGHVHHVLTKCEERGDRKIVWDLYRRTLLWWLRMREYRYLARTAKRLLLKRNWPTSKQLQPAAGVAD